MTARPSMELQVQDPHPLVGALAVVSSALDEVSDLDPRTVPTREKQQLLRTLDRELARMEGLRLDLLAASSDVAEDTGARSAGVWLALDSRAGAAAGVCDQTLADALARHPRGRRALRNGTINPAQAAIIARALDVLPGDLDPELVARAEGQLLGDAAHFGPRELRILGRRVFEVIAPARAEVQEGALLSAEERRARAETRVTFRPRGDGVTDVWALVPDHVADRLRVYLDSFTAPRRRHRADAAVDDVGELSLPARRGAAFCALLEHVPADSLPGQGGTTTSVVVTLDVDTLLSGVGAAGLSTGGRISAAEARRLACGAGILPAVLDGDGEVLDLGRSRRLFSPAQRKAMAIRDRTCRAEGCDIPAAWCEAHHASAPWSGGGRTDLKDGLLLCPFHHHRAHDTAWRTSRMADGRVRFTRRT
ncbi:MAG TPA: DUF222 domain-containing protein [Nocardioides sp.]|nr:DUF222 domain-containing protein [Nocardioides sp.]